MDDGDVHSFAVTRCLGIRRARGSDCSGYPTAAIRMGGNVGKDAIRAILGVEMAARSKSGKRDGARWGSCAVGPRRAALKRNGIIHNASFFTRCKGITPK